MIIRFGSPFFRFGDDAPIAANLPLPALGERAAESILPGAQPGGSRGPYRIWKRGSLVAGVAGFPVTLAGYATQSRAAYEALFDALGEAKLYRIWNYSPYINDGDGDDEGYRRFCEGRAVAFEQQFGASAIDAIPAGSCLGADGDQLVIAFLAGAASPRHVENPLQVPAYRYPREYGPRSPSFARATVVEAEGARRCYVSGTSAVTGHASVGMGNLDAQMRVTGDNLETILAACGVADQASLGEASGKVYLRRATDYQAARAFMERRFPAFAESLVYLRADVCRQELLFEVELSLSLSL